jgi:hypothetical protein
VPNASFHRKRIIRVFRSSDGIRRVTRASLEWMPVTPYKPEIA